MLNERLKNLLQDKKLLVLLIAFLCALILWPQDAQMTQEEKRIAATLSQIAGAGRVQVTLYFSESSTAFSGGKSCVGALAVSEGAGDIAVRLRLQEALQTLLGLKAKDVVVLKMEESQ